MSTETTINQMIFNQLSETKYNQIVPEEGQFYITPDYTDLPILTYQYTDHILNDIQWLRADTFSWQSGDVYKTAYDKLESEFSHISKKHPNCEVYGVTCTDEGILSGFTTTNIAFTYTDFNPESNSWEVCFKAKMDYNNKRNWIIGGSAKKDYYGYALGFENSTNNCTPLLYISSNGTSWDIAANVVGTTICTTNTWYWLKLVFTGTQYILYLSTDGNNWNTEATVTSSALLIQNGSNRGLGTNFYNDTNAEYFSGSIDLNDCYMKINNEYVWKGILSYESQNGFQITLPENSSSVSKCYENGNGWYYILDTSNKRFKLPRNKNSHKEVVKEYKNGNSWYKIYSDGWCEQGGVVNTTMASSGQVHYLHIPFVNTTYTITATLNQWAGTWSGEAMCRIMQTSSSTFSIQVGGNGANPGNVSWMACGFAYLNNPEYNNQYKYLYFFMGNYAKTAIEQTAGINAEVLNGKMDNDLSNIIVGDQFLQQLDNRGIRYITESWSSGTQWYRKYSDRWIEQGGYFGATGSDVDTTVSLIVPMRDNKYNVQVNMQWNGSGTASWQYLNARNMTSTSFQTVCQSSTYHNWMVTGYMA